jgi:hypothetical protein
MPYHFNPPHDSLCIYNYVATAHRRGARALNIHIPTIRRTQPCPHMSTMLPKFRIVNHDPAVG